MARHASLKELLPPLVVSVLLSGMFLFLLSHVDDRHEQVEKDMEAGRTLVIDSLCNEQALSSILFNDGYAETEKDADFIASVLVRRQKEDGRLPSLFALQKRRFGQVPVSMADTSGALSAKVERSRKRLGIVGESIPFSHEALETGPGKISVTVVEESSKSWRKALKLKDKVPGVPVRLTAHFRDTAGEAVSVVLGDLPTDADGKVVFERLDTAVSYSVLPVREGFEYGSSKGTSGGKWEMKKRARVHLKYTFVEREHRIPLLDNPALARIKADQTLLVRSPKEFRSTLVRWFVLVMAAWWVLCLYLVFRKKRFSGALLASCMFLTGLCVLMMFSMHDPLNDELRGVSMGKGVLVGLFLCILLQEVDFVKFYRGGGGHGFDVPLDIFRWIFKPYREKVRGLSDTLKGDAGFVKKTFALLLTLLSLPFLVLDLLQVTRLGKPVDRLCEKLPKGVGWLFLALLLTALLWTPLGQSVGGMRVNLNLGIVFQPSEIAKYLILLFMAAFFTGQADTIIAYSRPNRIDKLGSKLKSLFWIILGLALLMLLYFALGDMGPGLVVGITFILLYSLVKSKVNLENLDEEGRWRRIFTCDFALLVYGVCSFVAFLVVGRLLGNALLFAGLWFAVWIGGFWLFRRQLSESAVMMNLVVFLFIFGGQLIGGLPGARAKSTAERFDDRMEMCVNTWGDLDVAQGGLEADPVSNTQVANGLWALASGGMTGQGWGRGKPSLVPAFHTDMILSSIGEQLGWVGLLLILLALAVLLRKMAVTGYRTGHPFAFYLCLGFAVVTGVQFFVIALGSTGMVPLTGVTVPFLSYGRVSMILNLAAFGVVLSLCNNARDGKDAVSSGSRTRSVEQYGYPVAMVTLVFLLFAVFTSLVWLHYQLWNRDSTLIRPAYVLNTQGAPDLSYNPRISLLEQNLSAGRIWDRNKVLLATSDKDEVNVESIDFSRMGFKGEALNREREKVQDMLKRNLKRYYPLGDQTLFMVGDQNEGGMFPYYEATPLGYLADAQHLSLLRGFDNILYDESGKPVKVSLTTDKFKENAYLPPADARFDGIQLRDYSALLGYLKDGIDGKKVEDHNRQVKAGEYDLQLTLDAALQADLQNSMAEYMKKTLKQNRNFHLMRVSAVVLDAQSGDLLASANYPLPDRRTIQEEMDHPYSDNQQDTSWKAYTDRDLGTTYATAPGSTAKVMSAMAGFRKLGVAAGNEKYFVSVANRIEAGIEPVDNVSMYDAIVQSSNCYFVNLVNDKDLYGELETVYSTVGVNIGGITPYIYTPQEDAQWRRDFHEKIDRNRQTALHKYDLFNQGKLRDPKDRKIKARERTNMSVPDWKWAWGQGYSLPSGNKRESFDILATPLNMARVASAVVNNGKMPVTRYVLSYGGQVELPGDSEPVQLMKPEEASILKGYMKAETANQRSRNNVVLPANFGGKTGTPERSRVLENLKTVELNDGWYMFFVEKDATHRSIAVAVRMERGVGSGAAVRLTKGVLEPVLRDHHYIQ